MIGGSSIGRPITSMGSTLQKGSSPTLTDGKIICEVSMKDKVIYTFLGASFAWWWYVGRKKR
jgi:hypothetical protein